MRKRTLAKSLNSAFEGFVYALARQKNMKLHLFVAAVALCLGIYLNLTILEISVLLLVIAFVFIAEIMNTIVEITVEFIDHHHRELKQRVKSIAAAAVLIASSVAVIIGYLILIRPLNLGIEEKIIKIRHSPWQITLFSLVVVLFIVTAKKLLSLSKRRIIPLSLEGGMPSGHSAVAFSILTAIALLSKDGFIISLSFVLVVLMLQSRVKQSVHNFGEIVVGGIIGILITILIFQLLG